MRHAPLTGSVRLASTLATCICAASDRGDASGKREYGMTRTFLAVAAFIAATANFATLHKAAAQDLEKGQHSFNKCLPCHAVGPGAENKVGPELNGLVAATPARPRISTIPTAIRIQASFGTRRHSKTISAARRPRFLGRRWRSQALPIRRRLRICGLTSSNSTPMARSRNRLPIPALIWRKLRASR